MASTATPKTRSKAKRPSRSSSLKIKPRPMVSEVRRSKKLHVPNEKKSSTPEGRVASEAFAAGPRAQAVLRGREIARQDLIDSGGTYTLEHVRRLLNDISRQRVDQLVRSGLLLAVRGPSNRRHYPVVQFNEDGSLIAGLSEVQSALPTRNPWAVLNFLIHPDDRLRGQRPIELLREGKTDEVVVAAGRMGEPGA